jgi:hypothetical protein
MLLIWREWKSVIALPQSRRIDLERGSVAVPDLRPYSREAAQEFSPG